MLAIFQFILQFLSQDWLKKLIPAKYQPIVENFDAIAPIIVEVINAANGTGLDDVAKKEHASAALLAALKAKNIEIPGDADLQVCGILVEAMYAGLKLLRPTTAASVK